MMGSSAVLGRERADLAGSIRSLGGATKELCQYSGAPYQPTWVLLCIKPGQEKAKKASEEKQDRERDEKGAAITTIFSAHQGHGWRGETRENRAQG